MSEVLFKCPNCGEMLSGVSENIGALADCPTCGKTFQLKANVSVPIGRLSPFMCFVWICKKCFDFKSRLGRREFWWGFLFGVIVFSFLPFILVLLGGVCADLMVVCAYFFVGWIYIALIAAQVRRLHDTNKSGWWLFLSPFFPLTIVYIIWLATAGDEGSNCFGEPPMGGV